MSTYALAVTATLLLFALLSYALVLSVADRRIRAWARKSAVNNRADTRRIALARVRERRLPLAWNLLAGLTVAYAFYLLAAATVAAGRMV